jgi:hypothetical protein
MSSTHTPAYLSHFLLHTQSFWPSGACIHIYLPSIKIEIPSATIHMRLKHAVLSLLRDGPTPKEMSSIGYWERLLGFQPKATSILRNDTPDVIVRISEHANEAKEASGGYGSNRNLVDSSTLRAASYDFVTKYGAELWPRTTCPAWLVDDADRPFYPEHAER